MGRRTPGLEPRRRPASGRRRLPGVGGRRRRHRPLRRRARAADRVQRRRAQRRPDRLERGDAAPQDRADARRRGRRCTAPGARRGGRARSGGQRRGGRARALLPGGHLPRRRGRRLRARRRPQLDGPEVRLRREQRRGRRARDGRRPARSGRPRPRARPLLGGARRRRQLRRGHRARAGAVPDRGDLRGSLLLAHRTRGGDPAGVAGVGRRRPGRVRVDREAPPAPRRPVPSRPHSRPLLRPRRAGVHRPRGRRRGPRPAAARAGARDRHRGDDADERARAREHGPRLSAPLCRGGNPARAAPAGSDRRRRRGIRRLAAAPRRDAPPRRRSARRLARARVPRPDRAAVRPLHLRRSRRLPPRSRRSNGASRRCSRGSRRGTAAAATSTSRSPGWTRARSSPRRATTGSGSCGRSTIPGSSSPPIIRYRRPDADAPVAPQELRGTFSSIRRPFGSST